MRKMFDSLSQKRIESLTISHTGGSWIGLGNYSLPSENNYLNGYYQDRGFLGIGKSNFGGNSHALKNLMLNQQNLKHVCITARLKYLDGEAITQSLRDGPLQLNYLSLESICYNDNSMNNLSKFMTRQQSLQYLKIQHLAEQLTLSDGDRSCNISEDTPKILSDKALSDFFSSLGRCASASLEVISLHNLQINA